MSRPKAVSDDLLNRAAELRAGGAKWAAVAEELKKAVDTVCAWPRKYPARWKSALEAAERRTLSEASAESVHVLRTQLRSKDEKVARDAAKSLTDLQLRRTKLDHAGEPADTSPIRTSEGTRLAAFLDGYPDEELRQYADHLREDAPALRHAFVERGDPTSAA